MTRSLTAELLLVALDDATGKPLVDGTRLKAAVAGAAVVDLTLTGGLRLTGKGDPEAGPGRLVRTTQVVADPRLDEVARVVHGRKPKDAVGKVGGASAWRDRAGDIKDAVLADLVDEGVLRHQPGKVLGLFPTHAWPLARPEVEQEVRTRVRAAVVQGVQPDARTAALVALLHAVDLLPRLFPDQPRREVRARAAVVSEGDWGGEAVRRAVQDVQTAVTAAVVASTAGTIAASS
jgi:Golgi phosphoprotein 3 (GPP34)